MATRLCGNCFAEITDDSFVVCPNCGHYLDEKNPDGTLPSGTILGGRYIVGHVLGRGSKGIAYRGLVYQTRQTVTIGEYFPQGLCRRRSNGVLVAGMADGFVAGRDGFLHAGSASDDLGAAGAGAVFDRFSENDTAYIVMSQVGSGNPAPAPAQTPSPAPGPAVSSQPIADQSAAQKPYNKSAIVSLVCGIVGLFVLGIPFGIAAVSTGVAVLRKEKGPGATPRDRTFAIIGLVLGIFDVGSTFVLRSIS